MNRIKGTLARLGIRNFRPTLRNAAEHLAGLYTPEGTPLPPNVAAELERDIARLGLVIGQIKQIEDRATPKMRHREAKQWPPATMMSQSFGTAPSSSLTTCRGIARSIDTGAAACLAPSASRTSYLAT